MIMSNREKNPLVLVIDMQNVYSEGQAWECKNLKPALQNIRFLLEHLSGEEVIFTKYIASNHPVGVWKQYNRENVAINQDAWLNELVPELQDFTDRYPVLEKSVYSSFQIEEVREKAKMASCVIVTGVVAECCVLSTIMSLIDAGIYVIYLKDAVVGIDEKAEQATLTVLDGLSPLHMKIMKTEEYVEVSG